jgi:hypothetical protein
MASVFIGVCQMPISEDVFSENVFLMFAMINAIFKAVNLLISRGRFIQMLKMIQNKRWQKLRNPQEIEIRDRYSQTIRFVPIYYVDAGNPSKSTRSLMDKFSYFICFLLRHLRFIKLQHFRFIKNDKNNIIYN